MPLAAISENWEFLFVCLFWGGFWPEITLQQKQRKHFSYELLIDTSFLAYCLLVLQYCEFLSPPASSPQLFTVESTDVLHT